MNRFWKLLPIVALALFAVCTVSGASIGLQPGAVCFNPQQACMANSDIMPPAPNGSIVPVIPLLSDPGITVLPFFVVPGTVVLCEIVTTADCLTGSRTAWSDVVQFFNTPTTSAAQVYADGEAGVFGLPAGFLPSLNGLAITEIQTGTGTDADFTVYSPTGVTYQIHSDAASPEIRDPETPEPATFVLLGSGLAIAGLFRRLRRA